MSDTTDRPLSERIPAGHATPWVVAAVTDLERQLAEAREQLTEWRTLTSWGGTPEIIDQFIRGQQTRIHAAQNAEEQRDRLAEALRNKVGMKSCGHQWDCVCADDMARAALATLDRKEDA